MLKNILRRVLGESRYVAFREGVYQYREILDRCRTADVHEVALLTDSRWSESKRRVRSYKNKHQGERCFIIGNGPSLKKMDFSPLRNEVTFGLNRIYLMFEKMGFQTDYHVAVNSLVIEQCAEDIDSLQMPHFVAWRQRDAVSFDSATMFIHDSYDGIVEFSEDPTRCVTEGATVTYCAMQLAYYMGFDTVILIGVDHSFVTKGKPHSMVVSQGADRDHFAADYFGKGFRWNLPDLDASEYFYRVAKFRFERRQRRILDATVGGKLNVFPRVGYESLFSER